MIEAPASKSFTARRALPHRIRISPLVWMNLVCLDAPLVAVSWHLLFARSFGVAAPSGASVALFLTAWLIYLADRLGDAVSLGNAPVVSRRQEFCLARRWLWLIGAAAVAAADFLVVASRLDRAAIYVGGSIGLCAVVYLLVNRLTPSLWRVLPLKEISIGFIFAAGTLVGLIRGLTSAALPAWMTFACLCSLNCISIAIWERELDRAQDRLSIATEFPVVSPWLLPMLLVVCAASVGLAATSGHAALHLCVAVSALLLAAVHILRGRIQPDVRTALADLVLLTPLVPLLAAR